MSVRYDVKPLDPSLYFLDPRIANLFKASTGIQDDEELKAHILKVQEAAYRVSQGTSHSVTTLITAPTSPTRIHAYGYSHLRGASGPPPPLEEPDGPVFMRRLAVPEVPSYREVLNLGRNGGDKILLEIGTGCQSSPTSFCLKIN